MAHEPAGHTLQPTALVHEAYLRLLGTGDVIWEGRKPFFCAAATAMRRILVDRARSHGAIKRGGGLRREDFDHAASRIADPTPAPEGGDVDVIRLNEALSRLERHDDRQAEVVLLRYFGGLGVEQTARALGVSEATVKSDWVYAKAWLRRELSRLGDAV
jgi:RNA polymerase sigma factor (TIGR02999 family)